CTADRDPARAKPAPVLYLEALELLGVTADEAVAFEDSPNGVLAAKAARVFCVAVPNEVTRGLGLAEAGADLVLDSLADLPPADLFGRLEEEWVRLDGCLQNSPHRRHRVEPVAALDPDPAPLRNRELRHERVPPQHRRGGGARARRVRQRSPRALLRRERS